MRKINKKHTIIGILVMFWLVFLIISFFTPLAGDDWGYAVAARDDHPIFLALRRYLDWSGRFFSELWGYLIAPNKWVWDWLNPTLFAGTFVLILKIVKPVKNSILCTVLIFLLIVTVDDHVRMETYTWIMGTTYIVPLVLMLVYFYICKVHIFEGRDAKWKFWLCCGMNLYIPLCMENAAAALVFANVLICLYVYFNKKANFKRYTIFLAVSVVGLILLRISPGATLRLGEQAEWNALNLFEQVARNWNNFLTYTFLNNQVLIFVLSTILVWFIIVNRKNYKFKQWEIGIFIAVFSLGIIQSSSALLYEMTAIEEFRFLFDLSIANANWIVSVVYIVYTIALIVVLLSYFVDEVGICALFIFLVAGTANLVMLVSPIVGARSSIYTIFLLILLAVFLLSQIDINKRVVIGLCVAIGLLNGARVIHYLEKYHLVYVAYQERHYQIRYFQTDPEFLDAYFVGMPPLSVHSGEIEEWDEFHMKMFRSYYNLNPKLNIHFRYKYEYKHVFTVPDWAEIDHYDKE